MFELLGAAVLGGVIGNTVGRWLMRRALSSGAFELALQKELKNSFRAGFLTAADIVTLRGQEELAGELRRTAAAVAAENDNNN